MKTKLPSTSLHGVVMRLCSVTLEGTAIVQLTERKKKPYLVRMKNRRLHASNTDFVGAHFKALRKGVARHITDITPDTKANDRATARLRRSLEGYI